MPKEPFKIVKRSVKHVFSVEEVAQLNTDFRQAFSNLKAVEAEFDAVKSSYKAKTTEAESKMETLNATLQAGFEYREKPLVVIMDMKGGKKYFYLESELVEGELPKKAEPVIVESITDADRQQQLLEAEAKFDSREDIELFQPTESDSGILTVGRLDGKWYSALSVKIGARKIEERLNSEQSCAKKRFDQITRSLKSFSEWLDKNLGREEAKGFKNGIELVKAEHAEREE